MSFSLANPLAVNQNNVASTLNLLEAIRLTNCTRFIFSSTGGALMGDSKEPVNELSLPNDASLHRQVLFHARSRVLSSPHASAPLSSHSGNKIIKLTDIPTIKTFKFSVDNDSIKFLNSLFSCLTKFSSIKRFFLTIFFRSIHESCCMECCFYVS